MNKFTSLSQTILAISIGANTSFSGEEAAGRPEVQSTALVIPVTGAAGFRLLSPSKTGVHFTNVLDEATSAANRILENGSGVAVGDYDNDGRPDVFLCSLRGQNALYHNLGGWRFEEVAVQAGLAGEGRICRGAVFADLDGDGWLDLLVSTLGQGVLCYRNDGQGRFEDITLAAGTRTSFGSTTMTLADIDGNGTLDLYVANYRAEDIRDRARVEIQMVNGKAVIAPQYQDRLVLNQAGLFEFGEPDICYLNDGQGHLRPLSWTDGAYLDEAGKPLTGPPRDWGLTAAFRDFNGDGFPDLYVCNDYWTPDRIWMGDGQGRFRAIAASAIPHTSENSMGVDFADIDRDGHVDLLVLDMLSRDPRMRKRQVLAQSRTMGMAGISGPRPQFMRNALFHNRGDATFEDIADYSGLPASDWSWQPVFVDVDLDGFEDILIPAGHTRDVQDMDATMRIQQLQHRWPKDLEPRAHQEAFTREMMEHVRLYPRLPMPIVAYRNQGDLRFQEMTRDWGTDTIGVHQGIALADFDGDGDLDFVVNNLNGACGIYRNETSAPRVAVRLEGLPPNTQGIGARIRLRGGAVPIQSQEVACGGRYLSGFDPLLVFAAGRARTGMLLEVCWRSGRVSVVTNVLPNQLYRIRELTSSSRVPSTWAGTKDDRRPLFQDVSDRINHVHVENAFDDAARQPLLPRRLSRLGPGVGWADIDGDERDDLIIPSGAGGVLGVYQNQGQGTFRPRSGLPVSQPVARDQTAIVSWHSGKDQLALLVGVANYEIKATNLTCVQQYDLARNLVEENLSDMTASAGPLALADLDGDGDLDLFVGGRVIPGRYPEPTSSRIYRCDHGQWKIDETNSRRLEKVGLVSGAVWSDLNGNGYPDLVLACEWGPVRVFENQAGQLRETTSAVGLQPYTGWWSGVTTGDIDGDGRLDIIAGNWGLNSPYRATPEQPLRLYYGDFTGQGMVELIETEYDEVLGALAPRHRLDYLAAGLPFLRERFATFRSFGDARIDEVLGELKPRAKVVEVRTLASTLFYNRGRHFDAVALPPAAQYAPAFSVNVADIDGDGWDDIFLSQNFFDLPRELPRADAGRGLWLRGSGTGELAPMPGQNSGIQVCGEQRGAALSDFDQDGRVDLVITQNGGPTKLYRNTGARPGLRVQLIGPPGNPTGVGAVMQLQYGDRLGPAREIHAGSGYWSQDSAVQVLGLPQTPSQVKVRWPGGKTTTSAVPPGARSVRIRTDGEVQ